MVFSTWFGYHLLQELLLAMCVKRFMVASNCNAIFFWSLAHGLDIVYYKFQWVVNCPPQDNKNIQKAYKESREDDPFELKKSPKSNLKCAKAPIPCLMPFLTSLLWCLLIPKWVSVIFSKMTFIFFFELLIFGKILCMWFQCHMDWSVIFPHPKTMCQKLVRWCHLYDEPSRK